MWLNIVQFEQFVEDVWSSISGTTDPGSFYKENFLELSGNNLYQK